MSPLPGDGNELALADLVDRLIDGGVVLTGDIVLSVAEVDLVYLGLRLVLAPVRKLGSPLPPFSPDQSGP